MKDDNTKNEFLGQMLDSYYLDIQSQSVVRFRKIHINEQVDDISMFKAMHGLDKIKNLDDVANIPMSKRLPIEIVINSYGGYCYDGLALISKILHFRELGYEIITTTTGKAMSMGFMIFIVGSKRQLYKYGVLMAHQVSAGMYGTFKDMEERLEETKAIWNDMKEIIVEHTDITMEQLNEITDGKHDWYIRRDEALKLNCADIIL